MTGEVCFIDCETTGLDADRHQIWEVALICPDGTECVWQFPIDEVAADPFSLDLCRYWDRRLDEADSEQGIEDAIYMADDEDRRAAFAPDARWGRLFRDLTAGAHLVGAVTSFDEERLRRLLHRLGVLHRWHYHLADVENMAAGALKVPPPWDSNDLSLAVGVDPERFDRHTALGDARWAKAVYEAVLGDQPPAHLAADRWPEVSGGYWSGDGVRSCGTCAPPLGWPIPRMFRPGHDVICLRCGAFWTWQPRPIVVEKGSPVDLLGEGHRVSTWTEP